MSENKDNHGFSVSVAQEIGVHRAIMLQHFRHLQIAFVEAEKSAIEIWIKRSRRALTETYPYLSEKEIRGSLDRLERDDYIRAKVDNALNYDRTKSYQLSKKGWELLGLPPSAQKADREQKASDKRANGFDKRANDNVTKGPMSIGSCSSVVTSFVEGERTPPAPNPSNLQSQKKENGLVAPGREKSTADIIFETAAEYGIEAEIPPSKKVAPKKDSPKICVTCAGVGSTHGWDGPEICEDCGGNGNESAQFDVTAIASPTRLPGVTLVEAAPKPIQPWERPLPGSPKELKNVLLRYSEENPENWRDNVLESGRATGMTKEKIDEYLTDFCAWQFQQDSTKGKLSQYTAGFSLWLKRQPRFEVMNAPKEGSQTRNSQQTPPPNYQTQTRH